MLLYIWITKRKGGVFMNKKIFIVFVAFLIVTILAICVFEKVSYSKKGGDTVGCTFKNNKIYDTKIISCSTQEYVNTVNTAMQNMKDMELSNKSIILENEEEENKENKPTLENKPKSISTKVTEKETQDELIQNASPSVSSEEKAVSENVQKVEQTDSSTDVDKNVNSTNALANTTYRKVNTSILSEIIDIINSEIAKDEELVAYGSKAMRGNKANAYKQTSCFTYLIVHDIMKGKVVGNYTTFTERVRNNVGAFGNYYVYAEDEYTYNSKGEDPRWSQTLVWIYVTF